MRSLAVPSDQRKYSQASGTFSPTERTLSTVCSDDQVSQSSSPRRSTSSQSCEMALILETRSVNTSRTRSPHDTDVTDSPLKEVREVEEKEEVFVLEVTVGHPAEPEIKTRSNRSSSESQKSSSDSGSRCSVRKLTPSGEVSKRRKEPANRVGAPLQQRQRKPKVEELDKFWLRRFRNYMSSQKERISYLPPEAQDFWSYYLSREGEPAPRTRFPSFNREYKTYLFSQPSFHYFWDTWWMNNGKLEVKDAYPTLPAMRKLYYQYGESCLLCMAPLVDSPQVFTVREADELWDKLISEAFAEIVFQEEPPKRTRFNPNATIRFRR